MNYHLGIDIGGSIIKAALLSGFRYPPAESLTAKTPGNKREFLYTLTHIINSLAPKKNLRGIGVGLPGIITPKGDILARAPNLPFLNGWRVRDFFKKFKVQVKVDNDANCFVLAEAVMGEGRKHKNIAAITMGTGIGGGIMIDGNIYRGSHNSAGEFGHMVFEVANSKKKSSSSSWESLWKKEVFLKKRDCSAIMGIGAANLINAFDPDIIILGGGMAKHAVKLAEMKRVAKKHTLSPLSKKIPIVRTTLGNNAAAIGAVLLFK